MKIYKFPRASEYPAIISRPVNDSRGMEKKLRRILDTVRKKGDKALKAYSRKYDGVRIENIEVSREEIDKAALQVPEILKQAILQAKDNIEKFHRVQSVSEQVVETMPGVTCWRRSVPLESVGLYIPGGTAPLFSTVLMLAIPAVIAGCRNIVLVSPANIHPAILYAASVCKVNRIFRSGGAQAIAALAYGTETIPKVQKILGPGNQYVTMAKQMVQQEVAIDMPAGPSELLITADESADPRFVAADLLSQAEHGPDSQVLLLTNNELLADKVRKEIAVQITKLPRKKIVEKSLDNARLIILKELEEAILLSNLYAPEHLLLSVKEPAQWINRINSAGSVFLGHYSPESAGDYASGTNHALPTNGYAAMYSGVSVDSFIKKISFQELTPKGLENIAATVMTMAKAEGLEAHRNAVAIRLNKPSNN